MRMTERTSPNGSFAALRRFARARPVIERCDFCGAELGELHQHLIEPERRRLVCVCGACAILFGSQGETAYRRVPRDVDGLLINRSARAGGAPDYFIAPIDECFKLAGLIRANWRGLSGGEEVWKEIGRFFADLKTRSNEVMEAPLA